VVKGGEADTGFNARFSAKSREYRYIIRQRPSAIGRRYAWLVEGALDVDAMHSAVADLRGEIDFKSFCQAGAEVEHHRCFLHQAEWRRQEDLIIFEICANRFLHNMVRILVGTFVEIGRGVWPAAYLRQILEAHDRREAGPTVPAHGLYLINVNY
jgi:tRNA pseudouridine38-40 synthase